MSIEVLIPPYLQPQAETSTLVDDTTAAFRPQQAPGLVQRQLSVEPRLRVKQSFKNLSGAERGALVSALRRAQGRFGTIRALVGYNRRGSFPAAELISNNTFSNGVTGWSGSGSGAGTPYVLDRVLRVPHVANGAAGVASSTATVVQYVPLIGRTIIVPRYVNQPTISSYFDDLGTVISSVAISGSGLTVGSFTPLTATARAVPQDAAGNTQAGDFFDVLFISLARCFLVDNWPNLLVYSDDLTQAQWTLTGCTTSYGAASPDGTSTTSRLLETAATSAHSVGQANTGLSAAAADYALSCAVVPGTRNWCYLKLVENTGVTAAIAYFNASTGAVGTVTVGANWSNARTFVKSLGGGFYQLCLIAQKTNAATSISAFVGAASADNTASYTGTNAANAINIFRITWAQSSVPTHLSKTTASVNATGSAQTGSGLYVKGLPTPATNGLLLNDDLFESAGELKSVTSGLDSDALGLGYLQFAPALFRSPNDNDPIVVQQPIGKFILNADAQWQNNLGAYADIDIELDSINE